MVQRVVVGFAFVDLRHEDIFQVHELSKFFRLEEIIILLLLDDWHKHCFIHFRILLEPIAYRREGLKEGV
jgi:hypothetical protein